MSAAASGAARAARVPRMRRAAFFATLAGAALAVWGMRPVESKLNEPPAKFFTHNRARLILLGAGLALFALGNLAPAAARGEPDPAPRAPRGANSGPEIANSGALPPGGRKRRIARRAAGALLSAATIALFSWTIFRVLKFPLGLWPVAAWLAALGAAFGAAWLFETRRRRSLARDLGFGRYQAGTPLWRRDAPWLALFLLFWSLALGQNLDTRPGFFHGDEAMLVMYGRAPYFRQNPRANEPPWRVLYQPYLSAIPRAFLRDLRPERPYWGPRLFTLLMAALTLATLFLLARAGAGRLAAWITLALLAGSHVFIAFSRMGLNNMDAVWLLTACALAWLGAWRSRRPSLALLTGILMGLTFYTYQGGLVVFVIGAALLALQAVRLPRALARRWPLAPALALGIALSAAPLLLYQFTREAKSNYLRFRPEQVSLLQKENLARAFSDTKTSTLPRLLLKQSWPALAGPLLWRDTSSNYAYGGLPIFDRDTAALILLGAAGALALWRRRRLAALALLWLAAGMIAGSLLTINPPPPYAPRLLMVFPAAYLLAGCALAGMVHLCQGYGGQVRQAGGAGWRLAAPLLLIAMVWTASIVQRNWLHYQRGFAQNLEHPGYIHTPLGFMEFLRTFPRNGYLVYFAGHVDQLNISCFSMFDTEFPRFTSIDPKGAPPPPPPGHHGPLAYAVKVPGFEQVEDRIRLMFPEAETVEIHNPHSKSGPTHRVYWVRR